MQLILKVEKPTVQAYFEKYFQNSEQDWQIQIYIPYLYM